MIQKFRFLSRIPNHRKFEFAARYYDAEKEDLDKRVKAAMAESKNLKKEDIERRIRFSDSFNDVSMSRKSYSRIQHQKNMATVRFLIILSILLILSLYIFVKVL